VREKWNFLPFAEAREYVRRLGLREWYIYSKTKRPLFIPSKPSRTYLHEGWVSMADWLGLSLEEQAAILRERKAKMNPKSSNFLPFAEAREYVRRLGLREWHIYSRTKRPLFLPSDPNRTYLHEGWVSMADWLGLSLEEQAAILRERKAKRNAKRSNFFPFAEAREYVRRLGLRNNAEWLAWRKTSRPDFIPSSPDQHYRNTGWQSMADWLGLVGSTTPRKRKRDFLPFEEAREQVRQLGFTVYAEWANWSNKHCPDNIPDSPASFYKNKGWISWEDWLGHPASDSDIGEFTFIESATRIPTANGREATRVANGSSDLPGGERVVVKRSD